MHLRVQLSHCLTLSAIGLLASMLAGCPARGIGDPCTPEAIPLGGTVPSEIYVETSSLQCRTRTCMVFKVNGDPQKILGTPSCPEGTTGCLNRGQDVTEPTSAQRVFCTCRCSAADGNANTPLCNCTDGFHCVNVVTSGSAGLAGGYCVPNQLCTSDSDCGSTTCNPTTGVCNVPSGV